MTAKKLARMIPDEAVEPLALAIAGGSLMWKHALEDQRQHWRKEARAACAAMLAAWPDGYMLTMVPQIILPLPTEMRAAVA